MHVVVAGTFGPLHDGHRALLEAALEHGDDRVVVGLTSDEFATSKRDRPVPPFEARRETVRAELSALDRWGREIEIERIHDEFGVAIRDPSLDALVVSEESEGRTDEINRHREERGMDPLSKVVVPLVEAEDGTRISSTRIVEEEIDEHGSVGSCR